MAYNPTYSHTEPTREEIDRTPGPLLLEFGAAWCGHCSSMSPQLQALMEHHPDIPHIKIEDGRGKPLGRSFRVKLWPTLVFLRDGKVLKQVSRPDPSEIREGLQALSGTEPAGP
jgi:thioredoxin 1